MTDVIKLHKTDGIPNEYGPNSLYIYRDSEERIVLALTDSTGDIIYTTHTTLSINNLITSRLAAIIDKPNGIAGLDPDGKVKVAQIPEEITLPCLALTGPLSVVVNSVTAYYIVGYSVFDDYTVSSTSGSVTNMLDSVYFTAPSTPGAVIVTLNGIPHSIDVIPESDHVNTPTITSPVMGATQLGPEVSYTSNDFSVTGTADTHISSDWQIATDGSFINIVESITDSATDKTTYTVSNLAANTAYFARVRYKGNIHGYSNWSKLIYIVTSMYYVASIEEAKLVASNKATNDFFGSSVDLDDNAFRMIVGSPNTDHSSGTNCGTAYIYRRAGSFWEQEAMLTRVSPQSNDFFGSSVAIDSTGTRVAIGAKGADDNRGIVHIYLRVGTTWSLESSITRIGAQVGDYLGISIDIDGVADRVIVGGLGRGYVFRREGLLWYEEIGDTGAGLFGHSVAISTDGLRVVVSLPELDHTSLTKAGMLYVFIRDNQNWTLEQTLVANDASSNDYLGWSVDINDDGSVIVAGAHGSSPDNETEGGSVYVYKRSGTTWSQDTKLIASDVHEYDRFGQSVAISPDGVNVIIGTPYTDVAGTINAGAGYLYVDSPSYGWIQAHKLISTDRHDDDLLGSSVSISNSRIALSSPLCDISGSQDAGAVYIYR